MHALLRQPSVKAYVMDQYLHGKALLVLGEAHKLLNAAGVPRTVVGGEAEAGLIVASDAASGVETFTTALAMRYPERAMAMEAG